MQQVGRLASTSKKVKATANRQVYQDFHPLFNLIHDSENK